MDVSALVTGMADLVSSPIGPQIRVVVDLPEHLSSPRADLNQFEMALLNLSVNARDAMPGGGPFAFLGALRRYTASTPPG